jgi:hypothetical protein
MNDSSREPMAMPVLLLSAQSFADAGATEYNKLVQVYANHIDQGTLPPFRGLMSHALPAVVNLCFSIELWLKLLVWQRSGNRPVGHDLMSLGALLPEDLNARLRANFSVVYESQRGEAAAQSGLRVSVFTFTFKFGEPTSAQIPQVEANTFDLALENLRKAFVVWRYIFEQVPMEGNPSVDMKAMAILPQILFNEFMAYEDGNAKFTFDFE